MRRVIWSAAAICLAVSPIVLAGLDDYSRLPDDEFKKSATVASQKVTLDAAIAKAVTATSARAASAGYDMRDGKPVVVVRLMNDKKLFEVTVDADSGKIMQNIDRELKSYQLPGDPVTGEPTKTASGLMFYDIRPGTGPKPPGPSTQVTVHYSGWLVDGTKFDSSVDRGQPATFP